MGDSSPLIQVHDNIKVSFPAATLIAEHLLVPCLTSVHFCDRIQEAVIIGSPPNPQPQYIAAPDPPSCDLILPQSDDDSGMEEANTVAHVPANLNAIFDQAADQTEVPETPPGQQGNSIEGVF